MYYPNAYTRSGDLRSDITSLPQILSDVGYSTAGFVANNPYVAKWDSHFDRFWNGGMASDSDEWYSSTFEKWVSRGYRTALFKKRTAGSEVADKARLWYHNQSQPRFLWLHLMEPHLPYYPGLKKAADVGLLKSYNSIVSYQRNGDDTSPEHMKIQRELYEKCVERFDDYVPDLLDFVDDDAIVIALGDHGEEFDHGHFDHERLYDECVRVPLFTKNCSRMSGDDSVRQVDIAPTLLAELSLNIHTEWDGETHRQGHTEPAMMITPQPGPNLLHIGIRTAKQKLIKSFDRDTGEVVRSELYDLVKDPAETENLYDSQPVGELEARLDDFVAEHEAALDIDAATGIQSDAVASRLENLGYK